MSAEKKFIYIYIFEQFLFFQVFLIFSLFQYSSDIVTRLEELADQIPNNPILYLHPLLKVHKHNLQGNNKFIQNKDTEKPCYRIVYPMKSK